MEKLVRNFDEILCPVSMTVEGQFPDWLQGRLYRTGPGKWDLEEITLNHFMDGCSMLYKITIRKEKVEVICRFLQSDAYRKIAIAKRPVYTEFGTRSYPDPSKNVVSRYISHFAPTEYSDNANYTVFSLDDELYCTTEGPYLWKFDPDTLEAKEKVNLKNLVSVIATCSCPFRCSDGTLYNIGVGIKTGIKYHIYKVPPRSAEDEKHEDRKGFERATILGSRNSRRPTLFNYCHSFGLSENFIFLVEHPLYVNVVKLVVSGIKGYTIKDCFEWHPQEKTRFHLVEKETGRDVKTIYEADCLLSWFHLNAYEEEGHVIADILCFEDMQALEDYEIKRMRLGGYFTESLPRVGRLVLPLNTEGAVGENMVKLSYTTATAVKQEDGTIFLTPEYITEKGFNVPTINPMFRSKKNRYLYSSTVFYRGCYWNSLLKQDIKTGTCTVWQGTDTMFSTEAVFVPRPGSVEEDDGVLLCVVLDGYATDFLLVLDAKTMQELGRAVLPSELHLPPTVHGCFIRD